MVLVLLLMLIHYNIPRKIRELQYCCNFCNSFCIITYQEKLGNYNKAHHSSELFDIITYQEKLGNYNRKYRILAVFIIITYQEKLGNYNVL